MVLHEQRDAAQSGAEPSRQEWTGEAVHVHDVGSERDDVVDDVGVSARAAATHGRPPRHGTSVVHELVAHAVTLDHLVAHRGQHYC